MAGTSKLESKPLKLEQIMEKSCEDRAIDIYEGVIQGGSDNLALLNDLIGLCNQYLYN